MNFKTKTIIIGSGIIGASHAYAFSKNRHVHVFDLAGAPGHNMSTGVSSACVRRHYSHPELALLATYGFHFIESLRDRFPGLNLFVKTGCLSIGDSKNIYQKIYRETFERIQASIAENSFFDLINRYPQIKIEPFETGIFDELAGYADPVSLTQLLTDLACENGAHFHFNTKIVQLLIDGSRVSGVKTITGETFYCDEVVIAGSYATKSLLENSGLKINLPSTSKRPVFTVYVPLGSGRYRGPIFADFTNEIYCKPESDGVLVGSIAAEDEELIIQTEDDYFKADEARLVSLLDRLQKRFVDPRINKEQIRIVPGFYDVNDSDWIPIQDQVGPDGLYVSFASSGHGFKLAFSMAELLMSQIDSTPLPSTLSGISPTIFNLNSKRINSQGVLA